MCCVAGGMLPMEERMYFLQMSGVLGFWGGLLLKMANRKVWLSGWYGMIFFRSLARFLRGILGFEMVLLICFLLW